MISRLIVVIYDGECDFCIASVQWVAKKIQLEALSFQTTRLEDYGLTKKQCEREVVVIKDKAQYSGAAAIAFLLEQRGNRWTSGAIKALGPISRFGYRWIASHRNSLVVKTATRYLKWRT